MSSIAHSRSRLCAAVLAASLGLGGASTALAADATEPFNNIPVNGPTYGKNVHAMYVINGGSSEYTNFHAIDNADDDDHLLLVCAQRTPGGPPLYVDRVWIKFKNSVGDLDMAVIKSAHPSEWYGSSTGTSDMEQVTVAEKAGSMTLWVWGWLSATGPFTFGFSCKS